MTLMGERDNVDLGIRLHRTRRIMSRMLFLILALEDKLSEELRYQMI